MCSAIPASSSREYVILRPCPGELYIVRVGSFRCLSQHRIVFLVTPNLSAANSGEYASANSMMRSLLFSISSLLLKMGLSSDVMPNWESYREKNETI